MNQQQKHYKVILIGDTCVDEYQYGTVDRISPEAPVPIFCPVDVDYKNGMAANVEANLQNLGISVTSYFSDKSTKVRMIDMRSKQHLLRIDYDKICTPIKISDIAEQSVDAVVVSDYNKGSVTYELIEQLIDRFTVPVFIDTKKTDLARFGNCFLKINELEYKKRTSDGANMIVTHGGSHVQYGVNRFDVPTVPVFDVCGAGDTFLAALTYEYLNTEDMQSAIEFAIKASAITVQRFGVYAPTLKDIT